MAFDWLGTFNKSQLDRLVTYALGQVGDTKARIAHLTAEQTRIGNIIFNYDKANVVSYGASPADSYLGRLLSVYQILGGDPNFDLKLRQMAQAHYLVRADETRAAQVRSDGTVVVGEGLADAPSAILVQQLREWMSDTLAYKREQIERKIRRTLDYSDQLGAEILLLKTIQGEVSVEGSAANIIAALDGLISERTYRAIADDGGKDPNGTLTHAPYADLEPGPKRTIVTGYFRTLGGYVSPNDGTNNPTENNS